ncbi:substrate-binding periplasmic protein [Neptuniibacter halophilus]|uniref:substrate-binding periplasmic protein n=1 Tax=Neptuniibacter halophilus TaxID=651666 RepID=UPI002574378B|nr:transporter substrate-binding domain-containing protein [Neptuniibacter halophilus]
MQNRLYSLLFTVLLLFLSVQSRAEHPIRLAVPDFPPLTYYADGQFRGVGIEQLESALQALRQPYVFSLVPNYGRAVQEVRKGHYDGFFLASENRERNQIAVLSDPVLINRWSWFLRSDAPLLPDDMAFKSQAGIATHLNTNTHRWLLEHDYRVTYTPGDVDDLLKPLIRGRVNAVFLAEHVFLDSCRRLGIDPQRFLQIVEKPMPMGAYISKRYLADHPQFMQQLNEQLRRQTSGTAVYD